MFGIRDKDVFEEYEELELQDPSPRKVLKDRTIYVSRDLNRPRQWGAPVLCDFGSAIPGELENTEDIQPDIYRAPEVILKIPWSYEVDIWNAGCMASTISSSSVQYVLTHIMCRSGIFSKVDTSSPATTMNSIATEVERT